MVGTDDRPLGTIRDEIRRTCAHPLAGPRMLQCPDCLGTLRRCCDSLVGSYPHVGECPAWLAARSSGVIEASVVEA